MTRRIIGIFLFIVVILLFCYFRLKPLYFQTVGYTYDQGRDFLKAAEIVMYKRPTFIGPTTGVAGVFHGAWWYYVLIIPFILFGGLPIGFYYFNFFIHFASFLLFAYFLNRFFGFLPSLMVSLLIAVSPYFIFTSIFVGNNIMVLPILLSFLLVHLYFLEKKEERKKHLLLSLGGFLLASVFEFELAFGLFLIPAYFFVVLIHPDMRRLFLVKKNILYFAGGFVIPFIPRVLFELKNHFLQTNAFLSSLLHKNMQNPNSYAGALKDRITLVYDYYRSLFHSDFVLLLFTLFFVFILLFVLQRNQLKFKKSFPFFVSLFVSLFLLSIFYKDNFFWGNYFEGIQYLCLLLFAFVFSSENRAHALLLTSLKAGLVCVVLVTALFTAYGDWRKKPVVSGGLQSQQQIVNYVLANEKNKDAYCVKIYTPPVIPYTYDYLFLYNKLSRQIAQPQKDWVKQRCWIILEPDDYKERREKWIKDNIPRVATVISQHTINDTVIALYEKNPR